ncbi:MAG: AraC family transcriptional regulator [Eubacteriales bacterium]
MSQVIIYTNDLSTQTYSLCALDHTHENCEIMLVTRGGAVNTVDGISEPVSSGDVIFISTRSVHSITDITKDHEHRDIYISDERLKGLCNATNGIFDPDFYEYLTSPGQTVRIKLSSSEFASIIGRLSDLEMKQGLSGDSESREICKRCLLSVIVQILGIHYEDLHSEKNPPPGWLTEFLKKVQSPECFSRSVEEIIAMSGYSHTRFSAIFKENYHKPFKTYINDLRLGYAESMLILTDASILDISLTVGYSSLSHFIQSFKNKTGMTPHRYRSNHQPKQN